MRSTPEHDLLSTLNSELLYANLMLATVGGQLHFDKTTDIVVLLLPTVTSKTAVTMGHEIVYMSSIPAYSQDSTPDIAADEVIGVLIVSPNAELRSDMLSNLTSERWLLAEAASGAEALEKMEFEPASLLLLDPVLPDLRTDDFKEIVQAQYPSLTIVPINSHTGLPIVTAP